MVGALAHSRLGDFCCVVTDSDLKLGDCCTRTNTQAGVWVSLGNAMKPKQSEAKQTLRLQCQWPGH
jgi:hypothetical protein